MRCTTKAVARARVHVTSESADPSLGVRNALGTDVCDTGADATLLIEETDVARQSLGNFGLAGTTVKGDWTDQ